MNLSPTQLGTLPHGRTTARRARQHSRRLAWQRRASPPDPVTEQVGAVTRPARLGPFWLASVLALLGCHAATLGALLNVYRLTQSPCAILIVMTIKGLVPLALARPLTAAFARFGVKRILGWAAGLAAAGALAQISDCDDAARQMLGVALVTAGLTALRPLLMQVGALVAAGTARERANRTGAQVNGWGQLLGHLCAGLAVATAGYGGCALFALASCAAALPCAALASLPRVPPGDEAESAGRPAGAGGPAPLALVFYLGVCCCVVTGSTNALEVPIARKVIQVEESAVSLLFFAWALGAVSLGPVLRGVRLALSARTTALLSCAVPLCIALYTSAPNLLAALVIQFARGLLSALLQYAATGLLQQSASAGELARRAVHYHTLSQVTLLLGAAVSVWLSAEVFEPLVCLGASALSLAMLVPALVLEVRRVPLVEAGVASRACRSA